MATNKSGSRDDLVDEMMERYKQAYDKALLRFEVMEDIQAMYDNKSSSYQWPTISKIAIPMTFISVEEQLPFAMRLMFQRGRKFANLIPVQKAMSGEVVSKLEDNLHYALMHQMDIMTPVTTAVKDCYKFGVGYCTVDAEWITPPAINLASGFQGGREVMSARQMSVGARIKVPVCRYHPVPCVVPMPDGPNVDGPNKASGHFLLRLFYEHELRALYRDNQAAEGDEPVLMGDVDEIVDDAAYQHFESRLTVADILRKLSGVDLSRTNPGDKRMVPIIPVLECYFDNEHVWLANGRTVIYHLKDKFQTLRSKLVKFSAWPDGLRWFPMAPTEASMSLNLAANIWYNAMVDLAMYLMGPSRVVNVSALEEPVNRIPRGPRADIKVRGNVNDAIGYMRLPDFPPQLFTMGDILGSFQGRANALPQTVGMAQAGLVRGGTNALETLLQHTTGRQYLAATILQTGGMRALVEKTLALKQLLIEDSQEETFVIQDYDRKSGKPLFRQETVTLEELRNIFRVEITFPIEHLNGASAQAEKLGYFDRAMKAPELFDKRRLYELIAPDFDTVRQTMLPPDQVQERDQAMMQARMAAAQRGEMTPEEMGAGGGPTAGTSMGAEAQAGATALGGLE